MSTVSTYATSGCLVVYDGTATNETCREPVHPNPGLTLKVTGS